jgi:hypothetical protein
MDGDAMGARTFAGLRCQDNIGLAVGTSAIASFPQCGNMVDVDAQFQHAA